MELIVRALFQLMRLVIEPVRELQDSSFAYFDSIL